MYYRKEKLVVDNTIFEQIYQNQPFILPENISTPFYCELVIDEQGNCVALHGSHDTALLYLASVRTGQSMNEIEQHTPSEYYCDYRAYLLSLSHAVAVWYDRQMHLSTITMTSAQQATLDKLEKLHKIEKHIVVSTLPERRN